MTVITYDEALQIIKDGLTEVMNDNYYFYKDYKVVVSKEQEFIKLKQIAPKTIYIVIKFGASSINFGQTVMPLTLTAMSEQNKCDIAQKLLSDFVNKFNLETSEDKTIRQVYELPVVTSNFNKVFEGYRSILFVNGFLVISKNANFFTIDYSVIEESFVANAVAGDAEPVEFNFFEEKFLEKIDNSGVYTFLYNSDGNWQLNDKNVIISDYGIEIKDGQTPVRGYTSIIITVSSFLEEKFKEIPILTLTFSGDYQLDSQPLYNVQNYTKSVAKVGTITFSITTFLLNDIDIINDVLKIAFKEKSINNKFKFNIKLRSGLALNDEFKLVTFNAQQNIGEIPMINLTFTN